jgi:amino acid adenylation domain-containing protein
LLAKYQANYFVPESDDSHRFTSCVHDLIANRATRSPATTAAVFEGETLTYRQLDRRSNQLAHRLIREGVCTGDLVAVQMERCLDLVVALVSILKAGAAYVPLDPQTPAARREFILRAAGAKVLVTHTTLPDHVDPASFPYIDVDTRDAWDDLPETRPAVRVSPTDLIYVLFTSGTTGEPKGVMLEHAGISNILTWMIREYGFSADDRILQKTPYTFDASVWELFLPLITGGTVVLAKPGGQRDPRYLVEVTAAQAVTTLQLVPSMLRYVLDEPGFPKCRALRHVFCGGEALSRELVDRFFKELSIPLHNLYGPTETSIQVLTWTCRPNDPRSYVPIGLPIDNVVAHVLDQAARPVPTGEVGELYIGGVAVARGYLGRPEQTAQRFIPDPNPLSRTRLYRTGDLVRKHPDGTFEFLGRIDDQVKIQGFRVELGEIEARLREVPQVRHAAVIAEHAAGTGSTQLVAYLEAATGEVRLRDLRAHLSNHLPDYMVPTKFKVAERLPLSAHGKLDKARLPHISTVTLTGESVDERPRSNLEQKLADIWSQLLGVASVGVKDDFFELGGDSITGLLVIARAKQCGIVLTPEDLFRLRRIDEIATAATQRSAGRI